MHQNTLFQIQINKSIEKIHKNAKFLAIANLSPIIISIFSLFLLMVIRHISAYSLIGLISFIILIMTVVAIYELGSGLKELAVNLQLTQDRYFYKAGDNICTAMTLRIIAIVLAFIPVIQIISIILILVAFFKELNGYTAVAEGFDYLLHRGM